VSGKFLRVGAAAVAIGLVAISAANADSYHRHHQHHQQYYRACVTADYGVWLYRCPRGEYPASCWVPVQSGRAFRVERQQGGYLLVRNHSARGWIELNSLRIAPQEYCRAAGL
jgi:hypothetical protein